MASIVAAVQVGHQLLGEDAATLQLPHLLLLQQQGSHLADNRGIVGEDPDDTGRVFYFLIEPLHCFGAPDLAPMIGWEGPERQGAFLGLGHQRGRSRELLSEHRDHLIPLLLLTSVSGAS